MNPEFVHTCLSAILLGLLCTSVLQSPWRRTRVIRELSLIVHVSDLAISYGVPMQASNPTTQSTVASTSASNGSKSSEPEFHMYTLPYFHETLSALENHWVFASESDLWTILPRSELLYERRSATLVANVMATKGTGDVEHVHNATRKAIAEVLYDAKSRSQIPFSAKFLLEPQTLHLMQHEAHLSYMCLTIAHLQQLQAFYVNHESITRLHTALLTHTTAAMITWDYIAGLGRQKHDSSTTEALELAKWNLNIQFKNAYHCLRRYKQYMRAENRVLTTLFELGNATCAQRGQGETVTPDLPDNNSRLSAAAWQGPSVSDLEDLMQHAAQSYHKYHV